MKVAGSDETAATWTIDWGDGSFSNYAAVPANGYFHDYATAGNYSIDATVTTN
jgi:hypothetical protein